MTYGLANSHLYQKPEDHDPSCTLEPNKRQQGGVTDVHIKTLWIIWKTEGILISKVWDFLAVKIVSKKQKEKHDHREFVQWCV